MKPRKPSTSAPEHAALILANPTAWAVISDHVVKIKIVCGADKYDEGLSEVAPFVRGHNPALFVRKVGKSHGLKFDTIVRCNQFTRAAANVLKLNLNEFKQEPGQAQIGQRHIAERLMLCGKLPRSLEQRAIEKANGSA